MRKTVFLALAMLATCAMSKDKTEVTYVGLGRYTCSGNSAACAQIDQNNRALERDQKARDDARRERERDERQRDQKNNGR